MCRPEERAPVLQWLAGCGSTKCADVIDLGDALEVLATVQIASHLFNTSFYSFQHAATKRSIIRQLGAYSVPASVAPFIEFVEGISSFPIPHLQIRRKPNDDLGIVPQTFAQMYQLPTQTPGSAPRTSQGVIEFEQQYFRSSFWIIALFDAMVGIVRTIWQHLAR